MSVTCEDIRDRFSAFWEKELSPTEQAEIRGHLDACPQCREEFAQFDRTLRLLRSAEEVDVPEGFLAGVYEKLEERKRSGLAPETKGIGRLSLPSRWKLPIQAFAMVSVVFLALYLTKMTPFESARVKDAAEPKQALTDQKKPPVEAQAPVSKEENLDSSSLPLQENRAKEKEVVGTLTERAKTPAVERESGIAADESRAKAPELPAMARPSLPASPAPPVREGAKPLPSVEDRPVKMTQKEEVLPQQDGKASGGRVDLRARQVAPSPVSGPKESERLQSSVPTAKKAEEADRVSAALSSEIKPSQALALKVKDRQETRSSLEELVKRLGGEILDGREDRLVVALPGSSLREFQDQLERIGSVTKKDEAVAAPKGSAAPPGQSFVAKRKEAKGKDQEPVPSVPSKEGRALIQIDLIED